MAGGPTSADRRPDTGESGRQTSELGCVIFLIGLVLAVVLPALQRARPRDFPPGSIQWVGVVIGVSVGLPFFLYLLAYIHEALRTRLSESLVHEAEPGEPSERRSPTRKPGHPSVAPLEGASESPGQTPRQPAPASGLSTSWERVGDPLRGQLVAVSFRGVYPPGSEGNDMAREMIESLRTALSETRAVGVVIDLSALDYGSGDAIGGLALPLLDEDKRFRPATIVATGRTRRALEWLLQPDRLLGAAGIKVFETRQDALAELQGAIARGMAAAPRAQATVPLVSESGRDERRLSEPRVHEAERAETNHRRSPTRKPGHASVGPLERAWLMARLDGLRVADGAVRARSAAELAQCEDAALLAFGLERLIAAVEDPSRTVRENLAVTLGRAGDSRAVPSLVRLLADKVASVRRTAAVQLGRLGDKAAIEPLVVAFDTTPHGIVREEILAALETLQAPAGTLDGLRQRIDVFDPVDAVLGWIEDPLLVCGASDRARQAVASNFRREGAAASDRLASIIEAGLAARSESVHNALYAVSSDVVLTHRLEAVLREVLAASWVDPHLRERVGSFLRGSRTG